MLSVINRPTYLHIAEPSIVAELPNLLTTTLGAYYDSNNTPLSLTIGASSNVNIESVKDMNVFMGLSNTYNLSVSTFDSNTNIRTDESILKVSKSSNNTTLLIVPSNVTFASSDTSNSIFKFGSTTIYQNSNIQEIGTDLSGFYFKKGMQVDGNMIISNNLIATGSLYGQNMNIWTDRSNVAYSRIGFALHINSNDQLEIVKYCRYASNNVVKKLAVFGYGENTSNDSTDANYLVFNSIGSIGITNGDGGVSPIQSVGGGSSISLSDSVISSSTSNAASSYALSNVYGSCVKTSGGTIDGSLTVTGDLTIQGTSVTVDTQSLLILDNIITLNRNQIGTPISTLKSGVEIERGDLSNYFFVFEESSQLFKVGISNQLQAVCTRNDTLQTGYVYFDSNQQMLINRSITSSDVSDLSQSPWTTSASNIYYGLTSNMSNVGIGLSNPSYKLSVNGPIYSSDDIIAFSDSRLKTDLVPLSNALDLVDRLNGYTFTRVGQGDKRYCGILAQEVKEVLPEVVYTDDKGYLSVAYGNMIALLIEAVKELKSKLI
jgi:hypothetical protein